jgi:prepilin-type N-terminal cleavage/methylation domain-containing protein
MKKNNAGFTMVELIIVILIIGFLLSASVYIFNSTRMKSRDAQRAANISTITKALSIYFNATSSFPVANPSGVCLTDASAQAVRLKNENAIVYMPQDPLWPATTPAPANLHQPGNEYVIGGQNFCYFYWTNSVPGGSSQYYISYFLETDSNAGKAGIHVISQDGNTP